MPKLCVLRSHERIIATNRRCTRDRAVLRRSVHRRCVRLIKIIDAALAGEAKPGVDMEKNQ